VNGHLCLLSKTLNVFLLEDIDDCVTS